MCVLTLVVLDCWWTCVVANFVTSMLLIPVIENVLMVSVIKILRYCVFKYWIVYWDFVCWMLLLAVI